MNNLTEKRAGFVHLNSARTLKLAIPLAVILMLALMAIRINSGTSLGLRSSISSVIHGIKSVGMSILDSPRVNSYNHGQFTNVIFLHRSTGSNLIEQGALRQKLSAAGFWLSDHGYNEEGLRTPNGTWTGYSYRLPGNGTDPDGLANIFAQPVLPLPVNTFSALLQYEVIAFKSCFPNSNIRSDEQFGRFQKYYRSIRERAEQYPDKIFILLTTPPLNPAETDAAAAARARAIANWLQSDEFLQGHPNFFVFDLYGYLAEKDATAPDANMLAQVYRDGTDSHPNRVANERIGPIFVDFVTQAVQSYRATYSVRGK